MTEMHTKSFERILVNIFLKPHSNCKLVLCCRVLGLTVLEESSLKPHPRDTDCWKAQALGLGSKKEAGRRMGREQRAFLLLLSLLRPTPHSSLLNNQRLSLAVKHSYFSLMISNFPLHLHIPKAPEWTAYHPLLTQNAFSSLLKSGQIQASSCLLPLSLTPSPPYTYPEASSATFCLQTPQQ